MTDYKTIRGKKVKFFETDLSSGEAEGQLFFSDTSKEMKIAVSSSAWHSEAPLITARQALGGIGTQTANLAVGGYVTAESTLVEEYSGSSWAAGGALPAGRQSGGAFGTQTSGVYAGGGVSPNSTASNSTQEYDGSSWTNGGNLNTARDQTSGAGTESAGLCCGGTPNGSAQEDTSEEYNGSTWTEGNNLATAVRSVHNSSLGIQTAALLVGGNSGSATSGVQSYDGTTWTAGTALPAARFTLATSGTQTAGMAFGGNDGSNIKNTSFNFDGSSWTATPNLSTARDGLGGSPSGSNTAAVASGGRQPGPANSSLTEEFNITALTITAGAWSSGTNYPVTIQDAAGAGPTTAAVLWGGYDGPAYDAETFEYDGTSWTESGDLNTARACYHCGAGSQTAALQASGYATTDHTANSEEYNGTAWTEGNNLNNPRYSATGGGIQTSALICGGNGDPGNSASTFNESYNGTSWSNETALPGTTAGGKQYSGTGETASLIIGFGSDKNDTLSYDGSSWTDLGHHLIEGKTTAAGGSQQGTTTAALIAGGYDPSPAIVARSQVYDGTSWATSPSLATARRGGGASGTATDCLAVGGERPAQSNAVEEFIGETTTLNLKTITDS